MIIRNWKFEDILAVSGLEKESFGGEAWSYKTLVSAFESGASYGLVAEDGGEIVGYGCITCAADSSDLENVVVAENYRRSGIGRLIVEGLLSEARARGAEQTFLEVRVSNVPAMRLYLKCGFAGAYARTRYYSDGEDCLVMKKSFAEDKKRKK